MDASEYLHAQEPEMVPIDVLKVYDGNAKKHTREQLDAVENSIREFGFRGFVIAWHNEDGVPEIVAGHARTTAARNLGMTEVPVVYCDDLTDAQRRALTLADNQTTMMTGWDDDQLAYELETLSGAFDMGDFGFESLEDMEEGAQVSVKDVEAFEDVPARVCAGEIWLLGKHRLMCGDSTNLEQVGVLMNGGRADLCFTSPPYNAGQFMVGDSAGEMYVKKSRGSMYGNYTDDLSDDSYRDFLCAALDSAIAHADDVLFNIGFTSGALRGTAEFIGCNASRFGGAIIWKKYSAFPPFFPSQFGIMANVCEPIYLFNAEGSRKLHHPQWSQGDYSVNCIETANASSGNEYAKDHEATFPIELPSEILERFCSESVLDIFGGTGTTLIAADQLNKTCYMMELDPHYCDIIIDRWERLAGRKAIKAE